MVGDLCRGSCACVLYILWFNCGGLSKVGGVLCVDRLCVLQAEDGIRDLVRSRGLGDVYKRQVLNRGGRLDLEQLLAVVPLVEGLCLVEALVTLEPVSYTHLTLPTSDLV